MAIDAMKACKHVFVEKPLAMNSAQAEDMISTSKENEVQLMVGHLLQYHPIFITLRDLVDAKALGSIDYIYSNRLSLGKIRTEEDVVWSFAPHDISMILALAGAEPKEIRTESSSIVQRHIADTATIHMKFESNLRAHISVSWLHPFKEQKLVVIGKKAMAVFDDTKPWDEKLAIYKHEVSINDENPVLNKSDVEYIKVSKAEPLRNECQHFLDVVGNNCVPLTNSSEGLSVLRVLTASHLSAESGEPIKLEIL
jgi:UDP-2-acetamido-3-amino-2,3-dideoxy-glucuronate N-acetyltransferase